MSPATPSRILPKSRTHQSRIQNETTTDARDRRQEAHSRNVEPCSNPNSAFHFPSYFYSKSPPSFDGVDSLLIVCCHGIFHPDASASNFPTHNPLDERNWHLAPFQKSNPETGKPGEHETFLAHVLAGRDALKNAPLADRAVLVLSGGATKQALTPLSEARSYYNAALAHELIHGSRGEGSVQSLLQRNRLLLEEHATDSLQNLLFSILLFRRTTGKYPKQIRIITHAFKAKRFLGLHAAAIKWPSQRVQVQGIDPVMSSGELEETLEGEQEHGFAPWLQDPLGTGEKLGRKRKQRGWDETTASRLVEGLEEPVKALMNGIVREDLPWAEHTQVET